MRPILSLFVAATCCGLQIVTEAARPAPAGADKSLLMTQLLVTWYGNPNSPRMGVLGRYTGAERVEGLRKQARAFEGVTAKRVVPGYELVVVVAQDLPGTDEMWRRREPKEMVDSLLQEARANGFILVLDVQIGHSTVTAELAYLQSYLEQPDVYLALDPEFDMAPDERPGAEVGQMQATEVNDALTFLGQLITANHLPRKVLIVHQFTTHMLPDKPKISENPLVDLVLDMDGFGSPSLKRDSYRTIMKQRALPFAGVKLFYEQDHDLLSPQEVMQLKPVPSVVIYQ